MYSAAAKWSFGVDFPPFLCRCELWMLSIYIEHCSPWDLRRRNAVRKLDRVGRLNIPSNCSHTLPCT